jgi:hypothetical protein
MAPRKIRRSTFFPKNEPSNRHRGEAFRVEQKGAARGGRQRQTKHQQGRTEYTAEQHDRGQPGQVAGAQRRFGPPKAKRTTDRYSQGEARSRAEIEQPGKQQWIGGAEEELGHRSASAKQEGRAEREKRAAMKAVVIQPAALYERERRIRSQR